MVPLRGIWPLRSQVKFKYMYSKLMCHMLYHINHWASYSFTADKTSTKSHGISKEKKVSRSNGEVEVTNSQAELQLLWKCWRTVTERSALPTVRQQSEGFRPSGHHSLKWTPPYELSLPRLMAQGVRTGTCNTKTTKNSSMH